MSRVGESKMGDKFVKACILLSFGLMVVLGSGPIIDAWVSYGVVTGVFASLLLGVPLVGVGWVVFDVVFKSPVEVFR